MRTSSDTPLSPSSQQGPLPAIPVMTLEGRDWPVQALKQDIERCHAILDDAHSFMPRVPQFAIAAADKISRRWLAKTKAPWLSEVDEIAALLNRPGAYALNVAYEWGCTARVAPSQMGDSTQLIRILDWPFIGLGRNITAMKISSEAGEWLNLSWPGFTGALQAVAKGRFAAALNQAPLEKTFNTKSSIAIPFDWALSRKRVWRSNAPAPVHLLRQVFETAQDYEEAKERLCHHPLAIPAIFTLSGVDGAQGCVIERQRTDFRCFESPANAANYWKNEEVCQAQSTEGLVWRGYPRAFLNPERACQLGDVDLADIFPRPAMSYKKGITEAPFDWLAYPMLNEFSRLVMMADAKTGQVVAQGIEACQPATQPLILEL